MLGNMATNHSVVELATTKELIGDPMEIDLLKKSFTCYVQNSYKENVFVYESSLGFKGKVLKTFDFDSVHQMTSAIAEDSFSRQGLMFYSKGSPEGVFPLLSKASVP